MSTGARRSGIWSLTWKDLDLKRGIVTFQKTKNDKHRRIPLTGHALDLLLLRALDLIREKSKLCRLDTCLVFQSSVNTQKNFDFRRPFVKALKSAGIQNFRWHDLRHSATSYLVQNGVPLRLMAEILGYRDTFMMQRYAHLSPEFLPATEESP